MLNKNKKKEQIIILEKKEAMHSGENFGLIFAAKLWAFMNASTLGKNSVMFEFQVGH